MDEERVNCSLAVRGFENSLSFILYLFYNNHKNWFRSSRHFAGMQPARSPRELCTSVEDGQTIFFRVVRKLMDCVVVCLKFVQRSVN